MDSPHYTEQERIETLKMCLNALTISQLRELFEADWTVERPLNAEQLAWVEEKKAWWAAKEAREAQEAQK
jgi:hypothetical protein